MTRHLTVLLAIILGSCTVITDPSDEDVSAAWPEPTRTMKPWTHWWWMGSAVDRENITCLLEEFARAGIGGVEITPIYGAKGYEDRYLQYLSEDWMEMLVHTLNEAERLVLEVTNLSANRLRDLERSGKEWKKFYDINMVNLQYSALDATRWRPMPSGLLGKVRITPLKPML